MIAPGGISTPSPSLFPLFPLVIPSPHPSPLLSYQLQSHSFPLLHHLFLSSHHIRYIIISPTMQYRTAAILAALAAHQATATQWNGRKPFSAPATTDNECNSQQQTGYDWQGLSEGPVSKYGGSEFEHFECADVPAKRDILTKRSFQSKCVKAKLHQKPAFKCTSDDDRFSVDHFEVSSSHDTDIECEYDMPDGSKCHESHRCSQSGSVIKNKQCGGAKKVTFKPGRDSPEDSDVQVHKVKFNCEKSKKPLKEKECTECAEQSSSAPAPTASAPSVCEGMYGKHRASCEASSLMMSTSSSVDEESSTSIPAYSASSSSVDEETSTVDSDPSSVDEETSTIYATSTSADEESSIIYSTSTSVDEASSIIYPTATGVYEPSGTILPVYSNASSSVHEEPATATPDCPEVLPKCVATWIHLTDCADSGDSNCFCTSPDFITSVMDCVPAWAAEHTEAEAAVSYLMGLCAPHVPENPAIITAVPSTITPKVPEQTPTPEVPAVKTPKVPAVKTYKVPAVDTSELPAVETPEVPAVKTYKVPAVEAPEAPAVETPEVPAVKTYKVPAVETPEASAVETPEVPAVKTYKVPAVETPEASAVETPEVPAGKTYKAPVVETSELPAVETPEVPAGKPYKVPAVETTEAPAVETPEVPAGKTYKAPAVETSELPAIETAEVPTPEAPGLPTYETSEHVPLPTTMAPVYGTSVNAPAAPGVTPAPEVPKTTITVSATVYVPVTYTTGVSAGYAVPGESTASELVTTVTIPVVRLVTNTLTVAGVPTTEVVMGAGTPAPVPAVATELAIAPSSVAASTGAPPASVPTDAADVFDNGASGLQTGALGMAVAIAAAIFAM